MARLRRCLVLDSGAPVWWGCRSEASGAVEGGVGARSNSVAGCEPTRPRVHDAPQSVTRLAGGRGSSASAGCFQTTRERPRSIPETGLCSSLQNPIPFT